MTRFDNNESLPDEGLRHPGEELAEDEAGRGRPHPFDVPSKDRDCWDARDDERFAQRPIDKQRPSESRLMRTATAKPCHLCFRAGLAFTARFVAASLNGGFELSSGKNSAKMPVSWQETTTGT